METNQLIGPVRQLERAQSPAPSLRDTIARYSAGLAVLIAAFLLPLQSRIWNGPSGPPASVLLTQWLSPNWLGNVAASGLGQPPLLYFQAGHFFILVYIGLLVATIFTRTITQSWLKTGLLGTLTLGALADAGVYWWGEYLTKAARELLFWNLEVPALLGSLGLVTILAFRIRRSAGRSRIAAALPFLVVPLAVVFTLVFQYIPHGPILAVATTLLLLVNRQPVSAAPVTRLVKGIGLVAGALIGTMLLLSILFAYQPQRLAGPEIKSFAPIPYQLKTGVRLHMFNTGYNRMSRALAPGNPTWRPAPAFVIEHPTAGLIVFDAGLSSDVASRGEAALPFPMSVLFESRGEPNQTLDRQMKRVGLDPAKVKQVILSHLHDDHVGNLSAFPQARIVLATNADATKLPAHLQAIQRAETAKHVQSAIGNLYDLLGDGTIRLIRGGGHSAEDLMAWVNLDSGPVLLAGDAVVHWDWLRSDDVERVSTDGSRAAQVRNQLRALLIAQPELVLFPGHDTSRIPRHRADIVLENPYLFEKQTWATRLSLPM
ncbi:MBL fold metallo-hydrolase [Spirosoma arcticum]